MTWPRRLARIACSTWLILCAALPVAVSVPPDYSDEALRKMCEEGLAPAAVQYSRAQMQQWSEQPALRARWAMRQMECQCQAALLDSSDNQSAWTAVEHLETEYRREFPADPRLPWLAWQLARADHLRAQQALAKWLATPAATLERDTALQAVRRVLERLDDVEEDVKKRLPLSEPRSATAKSQAPSTELLVLAVDCTLLRCEALLVRSRAYPSGSSDRAAAAADVDRIAGQMLLRAPQDWAARDELLVARATAGLEVGKRDESLEMLLGILNERPVEMITGAGIAGVNGNTIDDAARAAALPSPRARLRAGAVAVEALCSDGAIDAARQALQTLTTNFVGPEVGLSQIRVMLAELEDLKPEARAEQLKAVIAQAAELGKKYGSYWRNRADAMLVGSAGASVASIGAGHQLAEDLVTVEVRQLLGGGQTAAAITKLRSASQNASATGDPDAALDFAIQAAGLLQREKDWLLATDTLTAAADAAPNAAKSPAAYALAAWSLAQAIQAAPRDAELSARYEKLLQVQLERWPDAPESLKAEEYLASWLARKKRFADLAAMWATRAIHASDPETQMRALARWLDTLLGKVPRAQVPAEQARIASAVRDGRFAACQQSAVVLVLAATMLADPLTQTEAEYLTGLQVPPHSDANRVEDRALLSVVLSVAAARRGDVTACRNAIGLLESNYLSTTVLAAWKKAVVESLDELTAAQIAAWSDVVDQIGASDEPQKQSSPTLNAIDLRLQMLSHPGTPESENALQELKQLAAEHARDPQLQLAYACALAQSGAPSFDEAVRILKKIALGTAKNSDAYLRARWLEIRWRSGRGETQAASQIAALTIRSHEIEPAWWKKRFEAAAK